MTLSKYRFSKKDKIGSNHKIIDKFDFDSFKREYERNIKYYAEKEFIWCKRL